jgi:hypothetical protein
LRDKEFDRLVRCLLSAVPLTEAVDAESAGKRQ